jgi:hypothetical protein
MRLAERERSAPTFSLWFSLDAMEAQYILAPISNVNRNEKRARGHLSVRSKLHVKPAEAQQLGHIRRCSDEIWYLLADPVAR